MSPRNRLSPIERLLPSVSTHGQEKKQPKYVPSGYSYAPQGNSGVVHNHQLEQLEPRKLLAAFVVDTIVDENDGVGVGDVSLRDAITASNSSTGTLDTITFDASIFSGGTVTITLDELVGQLEITDDVVIDADNVGGVTVARDTTSLSDFRIFDIDSASVSMSDLTITGGKVTGLGRGGGIHAHDYSTLTLTDATVSGNVAGYGGGISASGGSVSLTGSTVSDNESVYLAGGISLYNSTASVASSSVSGNRSFGLGGGFFVWSSSISLTSSTVNDNWSNSDGGGISTRESDVSIANSTVSGNAAEFGGGMNVNLDSAVSIANSIVSDNVSYNISGRGGGIQVRNSSVSITNSTVSGNSAYNTFGAGGGLFVWDSSNVIITNSTVSGNNAGDEGGGIFARDSSVSLANTLISGNTANAGDEIYLESGTINADANNLFGHAGQSDAQAFVGFTPGVSDIKATSGGTNVSLANILDTSLQDNGGPTKTHALVAGSPALDAGDSTLAIGSTDQRGFSRINGLSVDIGAVEHIDSLVVDNVSDVVDGNYGVGELTLREAINIANAEFGKQSITFDTSTFSGGTVTITLNNVHGEDDLDITEDLVIDADANGGVTVARDTTSLSDFRVFDIDSASVSMSDLTITGGKLTGSDGGGLNVENSTLVLTDVTVRDNQAASGGGIDTRSSSVTLTNSTVSGNYVSINGGAIYAHRSSVNLINSTVSGNYAFLLSGGIHATISSVSLANSTVSDNTAELVGGGGIGVRDSSTVSLANSLISGNTAALGDEIYFQSGTINADANNLFGHAGQTDAQAFVGFTPGASDIKATSDGTSVALTDILDTTLADNGGPTKTHALVGTSPAVNGGDNSLVPAGVLTDQRGEDRFFFNVVDIGAVEDETPPINLVVDTKSDTDNGNYNPGNFSLREAIRLANENPDHNTITFKKSVFSGGNDIIRLSMHDSLTITNDVSILADSGDEVIIDGDEETLVFDINSGASVTLRSLEIIDGGKDFGASNDGGGLTVSGASYVSIIDSVIRGHYRDGNGGAISMTARSTVSISGSVIRDNTTSFSGNGGGIYIHNRSTLIVDNSEISGNHAGFSGGGIHMHGTHDRLIVTNSTISGNSADEDSGGIRGYGNVNIQNSTISGNSAGEEGGGIRVPLGTFNFINTTIVNNSARDGGGIYMANKTASVFLQNSLVSGNTATRGGHELYRIGTRFNLRGSNSLFGHSGLTNVQAFGNLSPATVGITATSDGTNPTALTDIINTTLADNGGSTKTHALVAVSPAIDGGDDSLVPGTITLDQRGENRFAGPVDIGAYEFDKPDINLVVDTLVDESDGDFSAGDLSLREAIELANFHLDTNTITFDTDTFSGTETITLDALGQLEITEDVVIDADANGGVTVARDTTSLSNFRIFDISGSGTSVSISDLTVTGGRWSTSSTGGGGILVNTGSTLALTRSVVSGNYSSRQGGGIYVDQASLSLTDTTLDDNRSLFNGAGIYGNTATISMVNSTLSNNFTYNNVNGAGLMANAGVVNISGSSVTGNRTDDGAGVFVQNGATLTVTESTFEGNQARTDGGGIASNNSSVIVRDSTFKNNTAASGGGIHVERRTFEISGSTFEGNSASSGGGGLNFESISTGAIVNTTFSGNQGGHGGGIKGRDGRVDLINSTLTGNAATGRGGGIYTSNDGTLNISNTLISGNTGDVSADEIREGSGARINLNANNLIGHAGITTADAVSGVSIGASDIDATSDGTSVALSDILNTTLADNGGLTKTHALVGSSPAIDGGDDSKVPVGVLTDQRGESRLFGAVDIGAVEVIPSSLVVDTDVDENDGDFSVGDLSLREAIFLANSDSDLNTITFDANEFAGGTVTIMLDTLGQLGISEDLVIDADSVDGVTVARDTTSLSDFSVFDIRNSSVSISDLTITGGKTGAGGGIYAHTATLTVADTTISGNTSTNTTGGGGLLIRDSQVDLTGTTLSDNTATFGGGGIRTHGTSTVTVMNSTLTGNEVPTGAGGGIFHGGGVMTLVNNTLTQNDAFSSGGGIENRATLHMSNTLLAGNTAPVGAEISGFVTTSGHNLIGHAGLTNSDAYRFFTPTASDILATSDGTDSTALSDILDPALADNGGPTKTHALVTGSPAINSGSDTLAISAGLTTDQRGENRFVGTVDIGAFEVQNQTPTDLSIDNSTIDEDALDDDVVGTVTVSDPDSGDAHTFSLTNDATGRFDIDASTGVVTVEDASKLNHEEDDVHVINVEVEDSAGNTFDKDVTITIGDVNEVPVFDSISGATVAENSANGTAVGTVSFTEPDDGQTHTFSLTNTASGRFTIDSSGVVRVADGTKLDHEDEEDHVITVKVEDNGVGTLSFTEDITITVSDVNEVPVFDSISGTTVAENSANGTAVGTVSFTEPDDGQTHTFSLTNTAGGRFTIDSSGVVRVADGTKLDHEDEENHVIAVKVEDNDAGTLSFTEDVTITVSDVNEAPVFDSISGTTVAENSANGTAVGTVSFTEPDDGQTHTFSLTETADGRFTIDSSGVVRVADGTKLDHEDEEDHVITVKVGDNGVGTLSFTEDVTITVSDVNEAPVFDSISGTTVAENSANGTAVGTVSFTEPDDGQTHTFSLTETADGRFTIDSSGVVRVADGTKLDHEDEEDHVITVKVEDNGVGTLSFTEDVTITVSDVNEAPVFDNISGTTVAENSANGTAIGTVSFTEPDDGQTHTFSLTETADGRFTIDSNGVVRVADGTKLDHEDEENHVITVKVEDSGVGTLSFTEDVTITVSDVNEVPVFDSISGTTVAENSANGTAVGTVSFTEPDDGQTHTFSLTETADGRFTIDSSGVVRVADGTKLDHEDEEDHVITVKVGDNGVGTLSFTEDVTITVSDVNEAPVFDNISGTTVAENSANGTAVGTVSFTEPDDGQTHTFSLTETADGRFTIDSAGVVRVADGTKLDHEDEEDHVITVKVEDNGVGTLSFSEDVTITVSDVNEVPVFDSISGATVAENSANGTAVGTVSFTEPDAGQTHTFSLTNTADGRFTIDSAGVVRVADGTKLDHEDEENHVITVKVEDNGVGTLSFTEDITITVSDVNEVPTDLSLDSTTVFDNVPDNTVVGTVTVSDIDDADTHSFSLTNDAGGRFDIDASTGVVTVEDSSKLDHGQFASHDVVIQATDSGTLSFERTVTISLLPNAPIVDTTVDENDGDYSKGDLSLREAIFLANSNSDLNTITFDSATFSGGTVTIMLNQGQLLVTEDVVIDADSVGGVNVYRDASQAKHRIFNISGSGTSASLSDLTISGGDVSDETDDVGGGVRVGSGATLSLSDSTLAGNRGDFGGGLFNLGDLTVSRSTLSGNIADKHGGGIFNYGNAVVANTTISDNSATVAGPRLNSGLGGGISNYGTITIINGTISGNNAIRGGGISNYRGATALRNTLISGNTASLGDEIHDYPGAGVVSLNNLLGHSGLSSTEAFSGFTPDSSDIVATSDSTDAIALSGILDTTLANNGGPTKTHALVASSPAIDAGSNTLSLGATDQRGLTRVFNSAVDIGAIEVQNQSPTDLSIDNSAIDEDASDNDVVGTVTVSDPDSGDTHTFSLDINDASGRFDIDAITGVVTVEDASKLNHEDDDSHVITVEVTDSVGNTFEKDLTITIGDVNEAPDDLSPTGFDVDENSINGTAVGTVTVSDVDDGDTHSFSIGSDPENRFDIDDNGVITVADGTKLDHETDDAHTITVTATDSGTLSFSKDVTITINDINEAPDGFDPNSFDVDENSANGTTIGTVTVSDIDDGDTHTFSIGGDPENRFDIDGNGVITVAEGSKLDHETNDDHTITITATDSGTLSVTETVTITINDINETPTDLDIDNVDVDENVLPDIRLGSVTVSDVDDGDTHTFSLSDDADGRFQINSKGVVLTKALFGLDHETNDKHAIVVDVSDSGGLSYSETITITINDVNEAPTDLDIDNTSVNENAVDDTAIGTVTVSDVDDGDTHTFSLTNDAGGRFQIDGNGVVSVKDGSLLNHEADDSHVIVVQATDSGTLSISETVTISIGDVNEVPGGLNPIDFDVNENAADGTTVGTITVSDVDEGDTHTFSIGGDPENRFDIDGSGVITVADGSKLDHETNDDHTITITATDSGTLSVTETVTITINDINETPDGLDPNSFNVDENSTNGTAVGTVTVSDVDDGDTHTFSIGGDPENRFDIDGNGVITVADGSKLDHETNGDHTITVTATDSGTLSVTETVTITINDINETPDGLDPNAFDVDENSANGTAVGTVTVSDVDDEDTHTFSIGGDPENRFDIDGNGVITVADGSKLDHETNDDHTITITATDSGTLSVTETVTITINDINEAPNGLDPNALDVDENSANGTTVGTITVSDFDDGDTHTFSIGGDPEGRFDIDGNGVITVADGTKLDHEVDDAHTITVTATDSGTLSVTETVTITINDINETPDGLDPNSFDVDENAANGTTVGTVTVSDAEGDTHTFSIGSDPENRFDIDGNGVITVADGSKLDHETDEAHTITVTATDSGTLSITETVTISVNDINEAPDDLSPDAFGVDENSVNGTAVGTVTVSDVDDGDTHSFSIGGDPENRFDIDSDGVITVADGTKLDHETDDAHTITVTATDSGTLSFSKDVTITINDVNEAPDGFDPNAFDVDENSANGTTVGTVTVSDVDDGDTHTFSIGGDPENRFDIDGNGVITVADGSKLDHETNGDHTITITATDSGTLSVTETVTITINDVNEAPDSLDPNAFDVDENSANGTTVGTVTVSDVDDGDTHTFSIGGDPEGRFDIDGSGVITVADGTKLDHETNDAHTITITVTDSGTLSVTETVTITVNDINEVPDGFDPNAFDVDENSANGTAIGTVTVSDVDDGDTHSFSIGGDPEGRFDIDGNGVITVADGSKLDHETNDAHTITITATDSGTLSVTETVTITINDINEVPDGFDPNAFDVDENSANGTTVGTVTVSDVDDGDTHTFSIGGDPEGRFGIDGNGVITVADGTKLDHEANDDHTITITATDSGTLSVTETVTITVNDINETPDGFDPNAFDVDENSTNGTAVGTVTVSDVDDGDTHTFSIGGDPEGRFDIDSNGVITVADGTKLDHETNDDHTITIAATDSGTLSVTETVTITVNDVNEVPTDLAITADTILDDIADGGTVGTITVSDVDAGDTHTFSLTDTAGGRFAIDSGTGEITVVDGDLIDFDVNPNHQITVLATDSGGLTRSEDFTIIVTKANRAPSDITLDNNEVNEGTANGTLIGTAAAVDAPGETHTYVLTDNAGGRFAIDSSTGEITLLDTSLIDYDTNTSHDITIRVTDTGSNTFDKTFTINVIDASGVLVPMHMRHGMRVGENLVGTMKMKITNDSGIDFVNAGDLVIKLVAKPTDGSPEVVLSQRSVNSNWASGNTKDWYFNVNYAGLPVGEYQLFGEVCYDNVATLDHVELFASKDRHGNPFVLTVGAAHFVDLVGRVEIASGTNKIVRAGAGKKVTLLVNIENHGSRHLGAGNIDLSIYAEDTLGNRLAAPVATMNNIHFPHLRTTGRLPVWVNAEFPAGTNPANYHFIVEVDSSNDVAESNPGGTGETNNDDNISGGTVQVLRGEIDLSGSVTDSKGTPSYSSAGPISDNRVFTLVNNGNVTTPAGATADLVMSIFDSSDTLVRTQTLQNLSMADIQPGKKRIVNALLTQNPLAADNYRVEVDIQPDNFLDSNLGNNTFEFFFDVV